MDSKAVTRSMAISRMAMGALLIAAPRLIGTIWLGPHGLGTATRVMGRAMGARDLAIGAGLLAALERGQDGRGWVTAGLVSDTTDLVATLAERDHLPGFSAPVIVAAAGGGIAMGAYALAGVDS